MALIDQSRVADTSTGDIVGQVADDGLRSLKLRRRWLAIDYPRLALEHGHEPSIDDLCSNEFLLELV